MLTQAKGEAVVPFAVLGQGLVWEGQSGNDAFILEYAKFDVLMGQPGELRIDCLKRIYRIRKEKGKELNPEENQLYVIL